MSFFKIAERKLLLSEHPQYVQTGFYRHIFWLVMLICITLAGTITTRTLEMLLLGGVLSLLYTAYILYLYYVLSRDKALVLEGVCIDVEQIKIKTFFGITAKLRNTKVTLKSISEGNDYRYVVPYRAVRRCDYNDRVSLYTLPSAIYEDSNGNVVISNPLFTKITKA